jgi:hypothetical protein
MEQQPLRQKRAPRPKRQAKHIIPITPKDIQTLSKLDEISEKKIKTAIKAFDKAIQKILLGADEIHIKGLFSLTLTPSARKRITTRGKAFLVARKSFTKKQIRIKFRKFSNK